VNNKRPKETDIVQNSNSTQRAKIVIQEGKTAMKANKEIINMEEKNSPICRQNRDSFDKMRDEVKIATEDASHNIFKKIDEAWPFPIVLRKDIAKFSCGLVTAKTLGTLDYTGKGIRYTLINGKVAYEKQDVLAWLSSKTNNKKSKKETGGAPRRGENDILLQNKK
jgi:hypothetical protein